VGIFNICARPSSSETPAFAKPPPRCMQTDERGGQRLNKIESFMQPDNVGVSDNIKSNNLKK
jgi:hypothetical protein